MTAANLPHVPTTGQVLPPVDPLPGIISFGSVNLLAGAPGVGKTALTAGLLRQFRDGGEIFGRRVNVPPKIAYVCADRGWHVAQAWMNRAGFPEIPHYSLTDDDDFDDNKLHNKRARLTILRECLDHLDPLPVGSLVCVDPIALFMGGNLNDYDTCAIFLMGIRKIARKRGITILGLAHSSKQKNDKKEQYKRLQDRILGSAAQHGFGDTQLYLASPDETGTEYYQFMWNPHLEPAECFRLGREAKTGLFIPWDKPLAPEERSAEEGKILSAIPDAPEGIGFGELVDRIPDASRATIHRYLQQLVKDGIVVHAGYGRYRRTTKQ